MNELELVVSVLYILVIGGGGLWLLWQSTFLNYLETQFQDISIKIAGKKVTVSWKAGSAVHMLPKRIPKDATVEVLARIWDELTDKSYIVTLVWFDNQTIIVPTCLNSNTLVPQPEPKAYPGNFKPEGIVFWHSSMVPSPNRQLVVFKEKGKEPFLNTINLHPLVLAKYM